MTDTAQVVVGQVNNIAAMSVNQIMAIMGAVGLSGVALEQALEKFGISKAPAWLRPYIPVVIAIGGTAAVAVSQGVPLLQALGLGAGTWVVSQLKHDHAPAEAPSLPPAPTITAVLPPAVAQAPASMPGNKA